MTTRRERVIEATDTEWDRVSELARASGQSVSRFVVKRATARDILPPAVLRRVAREILILAKLEEQRAADLGVTERHDAIADAVDAWLAREDDLAHLCDPGAANRWKAAAR